MNVNFSVIAGERETVQLQYHVTVRENSLHCFYRTLAADVAGYAVPVQTLPVTITMTTVKINRK